MKKVLSDGGQKPMHHPRRQCMQIEHDRHDALLLTDLQNDFLPGGSLPVVDGNRVIPVINRYIDRFQGWQLPVIATRDWHPKMHCSFVPYGGIWPEHCVAGSYGAQFPHTLRLPKSAHIISKGENIDNEGYSGFSAPDLDVLLHRLEVRRLYIGGFATDYCVHITVIDALSRSYQVFVLIDAICAVNRHRQDGARALDDMLQAGAISLTLMQLQ